MTEKMRAVIKRAMLPSFAAAVVVGGLVTGGLLLRRPVFEPLVSNVVAGIADADASAAFSRKRLNFLIVGEQDDEGTTDTIVLAHFDLARRTGTLMSIPRDTWVDVPPHGRMKINSAYAFGGAASTARVVTALTGVPIDSTLAVDPRGAKQIVDAIGGLNIDVEHDMDYDDNSGNLHIHLKKGEQFLTGGQVLEYMRFRHDAESDFGRMRRQQQVLHEIVREMGLPQNWPKLPHIVELARADVKTPLTDKQLQALVEVYRGVPPDNVRSLTLPARPDMIGDASVVIDDARWAKLLGTLLFAKTTPPQDEVLVVNSTGVAPFAKTVVGALRGGGWNVRTSIDEPQRSTTDVDGSDDAALALAKTFATAPRPAKSTVLRLGTDVLPNATTAAIVP